MPSSLDGSNAAHAGSKAEGRLCLEGGCESAAQHRGAGRAAGMRRGEKRWEEGEQERVKGWAGRQSSPGCAAKTLPSMRNETRDDGAKMGGGPPSLTEGLRGCGAPGEGGSTSHPAKGRAQSSPLAA